MCIRDSRQGNGFLGTGMDAGQAGLALARRVHRFSVFQADGPGGTYLLTDPAANTAVRHLQQVLPGIRGQLAHPVQELPVGSPVCVRHRRNPMPPGLHILSLIHI